MQQPPQHKTIKFTNRLAFKLTLWVGICLVALTTISAYWAVRLQESRSIGKMLQTGHWFSDTVKRATSYAMLKNQRESLHQMIESMGSQTGVEVIRVFNKKGRIMFSSRSSEIGRLVDMDSEACYACHRKDRPLERLAIDDRSRIFTVNAARGPHRVLGVINPIYTSPACYTDPCHVHPPGQKVLGVLDVALSLGAVDKQLGDTTRRVALYAALMCVVICALVALFTFFFVKRPLSALLGATRRITAGDYDQQIRPQTDDEIGELATAFDLMRQGIKEKTEDLEHGRREYQQLFEEVPCYITVQDADFRLLAHNKRFANDFGPSLGQYCYRAYKNRDSRCPNCAVAKTFGDGRAHSAEERVVGADGQARYFLNMTTPITDKKGDLVAVMEMATDITDVMRLEEELKRSEEKYRLFFNNDPNPIFVFDAESLEIMDANDRAAAEYRYPPEELIGNTFLCLTHQADRQRVVEFIAGREAFLPNVRQTRGDGESFYVNLRASYGEHLGRSAVIATTSDITERLQTEQQLIQAAKMATLGEMSAGVAHELNQPLSVIGTGSDFLKKSVERGQEIDPTDLLSVARELGQQVERARRIIDHLREFGRKYEVSAESISLNQPIQGVLGLMGQQLAVRDISVRTELDPDLPPVLADVNRLEQVLINLVMNARDAIEQRRESQGGPEGLIEIKSFTQDGQAVVTVGDNGAGIAPADQDRIFQPFFTTKEVGKGTGLGLSISYGIVRDFGGNISVTSAPGEGATFRLSLPVRGEAAA
ncbi:MAG: PAS domain S-box protein [Desulfarculaceae bacterium]|nr:PAS domain S-box protein [Desulfarculaceae bacterium]MCF8073018.1 PAS domain S-box protein [Desulfarculaceae bacterium]MCF8101897.1 PAS domain S-box protein [Desulfarculaceae bacterium]MCF8115424.1 PAS domain S-box protein [Desulfarculaceae bacterium]